MSPDRGNGVSIADMPERVVSADREVNAPADRIFEFIADPSLQPKWDGNDNLAEAPTGQRVHAVGDSFTMTITMGSVRENHVVEFEEGTRHHRRQADGVDRAAGRHHRVAAIVECRPPTPGADHHEGVRSDK